MTPLLHGLLLAWVGLLGLVVGSFVNVVAYRVPSGLSVVTPRSACPDCGHPVRARDNIPVLSWLVLRGRCRDCGNRISARYPLVEASVAAVFVAVTATVTDWWLVPSLLVAAAAGTALFLIDLDTKRLPDKVVVYVWVAAAAAALTLIARADWAAATVAGYSLLLWGGMFAGPWLVTGGRGMGFGDVKLAPAVGFLLGCLSWGASLVGLFAGFLSGAVYGVVLLAATKATGKTQVPYGPFMLGGALLGVLFGGRLFDTYLHLFGA